MNLNKNNFSHKILWRRDLEKFQIKVQAIMDHLTRFGHLNIPDIEEILYEEETSEKLNPKDNSDILVYGNNGHIVRARTPNQKKMVELCEKNDILFAIGPAGTGKTLFSCNSAVNGIRTGQYKKIILTRPVVSVEEEIGFLPGSFINKMEPWTRPIFDIFLEHFSKTNLDSMIKMGTIEISPLGYMRGRTFKNTWIVADEMQNSTISQMKMLLTRIGTGSRMVITGDLEQCDAKLHINGLRDFISNQIKQNIKFLFS